MSTVRSDQGRERPRFIWNLRDDIAYIVQAREVLLQHPARVFVPKLLNAAFSRLYLIIAVSYLEHAFERWRKEGHDKHGIIKAYLNDVEKKGSTADTRLETLVSAFDAAGIVVDLDVLADFSAISRLRNSIVHSSWKAANKAFIEQRGFPSDPAKLNGEHFAKIHRTMQELLGYLQRSGGIEPADSNRQFDPASLLTRSFRAPDDRLKLTRVRDVPGMFWLNLERISTHIQPDIRRVITDGELNGLNDSPADVSNEPSLTSDEPRIRQYLVARKASESGVTALIQHRYLGEVALESWQEYWRQSFESRGLTIAKMREAANALVAAHDDREYNERFLDALSMAGAVGQTTRNAGAVGLLAIELPIIDPSRTDEYLEAAEKALCAFTLMLYHGILKNWHDTFDREMREDDMRESQQKIDFYRRMMRAYRED